MPTSCWARAWPITWSPSALARRASSPSPTGPTEVPSLRLRRQPTPCVGTGLEDRFVVGYSGNLGRAHDIDTILEAIALIDRAQTACSTAASPRIAWLFIGG